MGKIVQRVSKRHVVSIITLLVVGCILGANINKEKIEVVESKPFVVYTNPLMDRMLHDLKEEVEKPKVISKAVTEKKSIVKTVEKVEQQVETPVKATESVLESNWETYKLTHYVATCKGCSGITKAEIDVRDITEYRGYKILSIDTRKIPLGSIVEIKDGDETYEAIAIDTGGAIKGNKLDLLVGSVKEARNLGVKEIKLRVVRVGWEDEKNKK